MGIFIETVIVGALVAVGIIAVSKAIIRGLAISRRPSTIWRNEPAQPLCHPRHKSNHRRAADDPGTRRLAVA